MSTRVKDKLILVVDYDEKDRKTGLPHQHVISYAKMNRKWLGFDKLNPNGATADTFLKGAKSITVYQWHYSIATPFQNPFAKKLSGFSPLASASLLKYHDEQKRRTLRINQSAHRIHQLGVNMSNTIFNRCRPRQSTHSKFAPNVEPLKRS